MKYDHRKIEQKWQKRWEKAHAFDVTEDKKRKKFYALAMFPYPSGAGLHVGHPLSYTAIDIVARKRRMAGWNVLNPMGFDAFGLPAENYAIKSGIHPAKTTETAIKTFTTQLKSLGFSFDWSRAVNTSSPEYYRWTQWLFLQLYRKGLAYKALSPVNWCPSCNTVLANEQVVNGACERCGTQVIQKELSQWFFKITDYAEELLTKIDTLDWPEKIKASQRNWIGKSEGVEISFRGVVQTQDSDSKTHEKEYDIPVFTTRPDTIFGVTYIVLAPEHPLVLSLTAPEEKRSVEAYVKKTQGKSELERTGTNQEKTGVFIGAAAVHPLTGEKVPIWIADYVLPRYGTGAVMGVPAHDERDWEFARANGCEVNFVVAPPTGAPKEMGKAYTEPGVLVHSAEFNGLTSENAAQKIADELESKKLGRRQTNWHLRDWLVSRQRYWGAPIPIIYCDECGELPVPEKDLPVELPTDVDFKPTGESPLARSKKFQKVKCPDCSKPARRESDTMDTFVDSSWYFLRYTDPANTKKFADAKKVSHWCPVDLYVGGAEHAVLHLLYARFMTKALRDLGHLTFDEPFLTLRSQGLILGENGEKMSKSKGNVVNPDEMVERFGADAFRMYEMFMGAFEDSKPWSTHSVVGVRRFLDRVYSLAEIMKLPPHPTLSPGGRGVSAEAETTRLMHQTLKKVGADIEAFKFNTAIAQMMVFLNHLEARKSVTPEVLEAFVKMLSPFAPHMCDELWEKMGKKTLVIEEQWPLYDAALAAEDEITLVIQVNGKVRDKITVLAGLGDADLEARALASEKLQEWVKGKKVVKIIVARGKLVNIVVV